MAEEMEQLVVKLEAQIDEFEKNFSSASKTANDNWRQIEDRGREANQRIAQDMARTGATISGSFSGATDAMAAFIGGGIIASVATEIARITEGLAQIGDRSEDLRLPVNMLRAFSVAADGARLSQEKLDSALDHFSATSKKSTEDAEQFYKALANTGAGNVATFNSAKSQPERLRAIMDALASTTDEVKRAQLALQAFGSDSERVLAVFGNGRAGLDAATEQMKRLGLEIDEAAVKRAQEARSEISLLARAITDELSSSLAGLIPTFKNVLPFFERLTAAARDLMASFAPSDDAKPVESLKNEVSTLQAQLSDLQAARERLATGTQTDTENLRDKLRAFLGKTLGVDLQENLSDLDKQIEEVKRRIDAVNAIIGRKESTPAPTEPPAFKPRPSLKSSGDGANAFDRETDSLNKHTAALKADAAAVGLTNSAHQGLRAELGLLQALERDGEGVTNAQIDAYTRLRATMGAQQALVAAGITLNQANAKVFDEVTGRVKQAAQTLDNAKMKFDGVNDALRFAGNQLWTFGTKPAKRDRRSRASC